MLKIPVIIEPDLAVRWENFIDSKPPQYQFTKIGYQFLEKIFHTLLNFKKQVKFVDNYLLDSNLEEIIFSHFYSDIYPIIIRTCIYEMHVAKKNGYLTESTPQKRFLQFVNLLCEDANLMEFFNKYPILDHLLLTYQQQYSKFFKEFLTHLETDYTLLRGKLISIKNEKITAIEKAGDRHRKGKSVLILTLMNDEGVSLKVVYKPHSLACDVAYNNFINWINKNSSIDLKYVETFNREDHGWCEFVTFSPCETEDKISQFYKRLGGLLAVAYLLNVGDLHYENLIACGEYPVIIDLECLLMPLFKTTLSDTLQNTQRTILDTMILPNKMFIEDEELSYDISALAGKGGQLHPEESLVVQQSGTDKMYLSRNKLAFAEQQNLPSATIAHNISEFYDGFKLGFKTLYQVMIDNKKYLLSDDSPLNLFADVEVRVLFRPTSNYGRLLIESLHPELLYDEKKYEKYFNWLYNIQEHSNIDYSALIKAEKKDLFCFDIPFFSHKTNSVIVNDSDNQPLLDYIIVGGYEALYNKVKNIGKKDLNNQLLILEQSLFVHKINDKGYQPSSSYFPLAYKFVTGNRLIKTTVIKILDDIAAKAIDNDYRIYWSCISAVKDNKWTVRLTLYDLYDGILGIALTYAYAGVLFNHQHYKTLALTLFDQSLQYSAALNPDVSIGLFSGLGAFLLLITRFAELGLITEYQEKLLSICNLFEKSRLNEETLYDLMGGIVGYLVALNIAKKYLPEDVFNQQSRTCLEHLFKIYPSPERPPNNKNVKKQDIDKITLGFAHGFIGVAWVLSLYSRFNNDKRIVEWINKAILLERQYFSLEKNNWPDKIKLNDKNDDTEFSYSWCYGLVGNMIFRYSLAEKFIDKELEMEKSICLDEILKKGFMGANNLCHGDLGVVDALLLAEQQQALPKNYSLYNVNTLILPKLKDLNSIQTEHIGKIFIPGLMIGYAGIAYQLMRVLQPDIPSILAPTI